MKKIVLLLLLLSFIAIVKVPVYGDEDTYCVYDTSLKVTEIFNDYDDAIDFYKDNTDVYDNLVLMKNNVVIEMEYGVVKFDTNDACSINVEYKSIKNNRTDYLNGCYGVDAAYLYSKGDDVYFMINSEVGHVDFDDVELIPFEEITSDVSLYRTDSNNIYHDIKNQLEVDYAKEVNFGLLPDSLEANTKYFSYDGHYFYDDFYKMIDDYKDDDYQHSINFEPYYNYFEYLPYRSYTNYSYKELEDYFYNILGFDGKLDRYTDLNNDNANDDVNRSQLYGEINSFFESQSLFGTNALMMISSSIVDTNYGKSLQSYYNNSLYTNMAFDNEDESDDNHYVRIEDSVFAYAKYFINNMYSNYHKSSYHGTFFGNKASGINAEYSLDPYYGEKCADILYKIDAHLDNKDLNDKALAIINKDISLYKDPSLNKFYYDLKNVNELSFVILDRYDDAYKIQVDYSNLSNYRYDFDKCVAYIDEDDVAYIINEDKIKEYNFEETYYDFNDGSIGGIKSISIKTIPEIETKFVPYREGYKFVEFDNNNLAVYKKIDSVNLFRQFENRFFAGQYLDLRNGMISINYEDGSSEAIDIDSNIVYSYDNDEDDIESIYLGFNGVYTKYDVEFYIDESYEKINDVIINDDIDSALIIKELIAGSSYNISFEDLIRIDNILMNNNGYNYHIYNNDKDISVSGMALSLNYPLISSFIYRDTFYLDVNSVKGSSLNKISKYANAYGFDVIDSYNINFELNYTDIELNGPVIIQSKIDRTDNKEYSVYHIDESGDVVKCYAISGKDSIAFMA